MNPFGEIRPIRKQKGLQKRQVIDIKIKIMYLDRRTIELQDGLTIVVLRRQ